jgi:signal peptidase II
MIFLIDQISKYYVVSILEDQQNEIYLTSFLNIYLIWNDGIAFGLFGFENKIMYNFFTILIIVILIFVLYLLVTTRDYKSYFYVMIFGGACGNLIDRLRFSSVPDFIDFHIYNFHWFIFNVADIFITMGIICLISKEILTNKEVKNENN